MKTSQGLSNKEGTATTTGFVTLQISGREPSQKLQVALQEGHVVRIGRSQKTAAAIPWDRLISREHADICLEHGSLRVTCLPTARNPILYANEAAREAIVTLGTTFRIGTTTFTAGRKNDGPPYDVDIADARLPGNRPSQTGLHSFTAGELRKIEFQNADQQLELLSRLPGLISESQSDAELGQTLCGLLLDAIPHASAIAVVQYDMQELPELNDSEKVFPKPVTMRVQTREGFTAQFRPSRSILINTLRLQESVLHVWGDEDDLEQFTISEGLEWALCAPIRDESSAGWCMYVSGTGARSDRSVISKRELAPDVRFTELVAQFIGSVRHVRSLQDQKVKLNSFFSPKIIESLTARSGVDVLAPAEQEITVLFCDVRGFSRKAEQLQNDLFALLESVRAALSVMVDGILERDGAIADFQGDAAMGFWGWPLVLQYGPIPACRAAIAIQNEFRKAAMTENSLLHGFSVGIGIAHGRAIAGQIGTQQQSKIGVFGPVVNQCARLESLTKQFGVSICIDGPTADFVDRYFSPADGRMRPLARVRPQGMQNSVDVFNLLPSEADAPEVSAQMIVDQESAYQQVIQGDWKQAAVTLGRLPDDDGPKQFLLRHMAEFNNTPPDDWTGEFSLARK